MKKLCSMILSLAMVFCMMAVSTASATTPEFVTISVRNAESEMIDLDVPYSPTRVVFLDYVALDMCATLGILDQIEYLTIQGSLADYLQAYIPEGSYDLGGLKEYDMEAIMEFEPELIFSSGRTTAMYDEFSMIAPTVCTALTYEPSSWDSFVEMNLRNASIFGMEEEAQAIIDSYAERFETLKAWGEGKTAALTLFTGGAMTTLGNSSRTSMISNDIGFENVAADIDTTHGADASYEALLALDPDYVFVLDRDSAISAEGASLASELLDNAIIHETSAWNNGHIVYLDPVVWYQHEGGLGAMNIMLGDLEAGMAQ